jgi:hypothetical protein
LDSLSTDDICYHVPSQAKWKWMFDTGVKMDARTQTRLEKSRESQGNGGQIEHFRAKRGAVGALAIGGQAWGALALGALAVGTLAVGRLLIGRLAVGRARMCSLSLDELDVKRLRVGELVITDAIETPSESIAQ